MKPAIKRTASVAIALILTVGFATLAQAAVPTISSFSPTSGPSGTLVSIFGTGFTGVSMVRFNGTPATGFGVLSDTQVNASVPPGATSGPISVESPDGVATSSANFTFTESLVVSCPFSSTGGGDLTERGFYVSNYPGTNIDTVTLRYTATMPGALVTLSARLGAYNGPLIGTATSPLVGPSPSEVTFHFDAAAVPPGSTIAFTQSVVGVGAVFFDVGNGGLGDPTYTGCPNVVETEGTAPVLDSFRRASVGLRITQVLPSATADTLKLEVLWGPASARTLAYANESTLSSGNYDVMPGSGSPASISGTGTIPSTVSGDATVTFDIAFNGATNKWSGTVVVNDPGAGFSASVPIHSWRFGVTRDGTTTRGVLWGFKAQSVPQKCFKIVFEINDRPTPQVARVRPVDDGSVVDPDLDGDGDFVFNGLGSVLVGFNTSVGAGENRGVYVFDLGAISPCDGELTADLLLSLTGTQGDGTDPDLTLYSGTGDGSVGVTDFASGALVTGFSAFEADPFNVIDVTTVVEGALGSGESFIFFVVRPNPAASGGQGAFLYSSNEISDTFGAVPTVLETTCVPH